MSHIVTDGHINNDVFIVVHDLQALLNGRVEVDIPDGASVHEDVAIEFLRIEDNGNRPRRKR